MSLVLAAGGGVAVGVEVGHLDDGAEGAHGAGALAPSRRAEAALEAALLAVAAAEGERDARHRRGERDEEEHPPAHHEDVLVGAVGAVLDAVLPLYAYKVKVIKSLRFYTFDFFSGIFWTSNYKLFRPHGLFRSDFPRC